MPDPPPTRVGVIDIDTPADVGVPASPFNPSDGRSFSPDHHANGGMSSSDTAGTPLPDQSRRPSHEEMLMHDAGLKMATHDREAIRRMRSTLETYSENSSRRTSPLSTPTGTSSSNFRAIPAKAGPASSVMMKKGSSERRRIFASSSADRSTADGGSEDARSQKEKRLWIRGSKSALPLSTATPDRIGPPKATEYIIAVVGHAQVGKSSFIRRSVQAHGCSLPVSITIGGGYKLSSSFAVLPPSERIKDPIRVEFVEMDVGALRPGDSTSIWPRELPPVHAAVFCYDATRAGTLTHLELVLASLLVSSIPVIVLACKSDPDLDLAVDPAEIDGMCRTHHVGLIEVTGATPEGRSKMRNALRWLLFKLEQRAKRANRLQRSAPEAVSVSPSSSHPTSSVSQPRLPSLERPVDSDRSSGPDGISDVRVRTRRPNGLEVEEDPQSSSGSLGWIMQPRKDAEASPETREQQSPSVGDESIRVAVNGDRGTQAVPQRDSMMDQLSPAHEMAHDAASKPESLYSSLTALFNRLFTSIISNKRQTFVKAFFLTYRRFCQPITLMQEFSTRLKEIDNSDAPWDVRIWAMMRLAGALVDWTTRYPGDLADEPCKALFREIARSLASYTFTAQLTEELADTEAALGVAEDVDGSWALKVEGEVQNASSNSLQSPNGHLAIESGSVSPSDTVSQLIVPDHVLGNGLPQQAGSSATPSYSLSASNTDLRQTSHIRRGRNHSEELLRQSLPAAPDETAGSAPLAAAKSYFLATEPRIIAVELTKMLWATFSLVRQRDVFRHTLGKELYDPCAACVDLFNRISRLVSTLIMADPKPKHRARMYEKFLAVSHHLRRLGNYDTLYAVIAGLQETSIRRLKQTHDLVMLADPLRRDFEANLKLFDSSGGQAGYRKAIATNLQQGKSALPLMSSLLSLVAKLRSARPNDFNEHGDVHWDKFAKYAEIVAVLAEAQNRGPGVTGTLDPTFKQIVDDVPVIMDEDDLFKRSKFVEPNNESEKEKPSQLRRMFEDLIVAPSNTGRAGS